jgi:hypothetical protein
MIIVGRMPKSMTFQCQHQRHVHPSCSSDSGYDIGVMAIYRCSLLRAVAMAPYVVITDCRTVSYFALCRYTNLIVDKLVAVCLAMSKDSYAQHGWLYARQDWSHAIVNLVYCKPCLL